MTIVIVEFIERKFVLSIFLHSKISSSNHCSPQLTPNLCNFPQLPKTNTFLFLIFKVKCLFAVRFLTRAKLETSSKQMSQNMLYGCLHPQNIEIEKNDFIDHPKPTMKSEHV